MSSRKRGGGRKNSWTREPTEESLNSLELGDEEVVPPGSNVEEVSWLQLLMMLGGVLPVYPCSTGRLGGLTWSHARWSVYPVSFMFALFYLSYDKVKEITNKFGMITALSVNDKVDLAVQFWVLFFCIGAVAVDLVLSFSRHNFFELIPQDLLKWTEARSKRMAIASLFVGTLITVILSVVHANGPINNMQPNTFFFVFIGVAWQVAVFCAVSMRSHVYTRMHLKHYEALVDLAKSCNDPKELKGKITQAKIELNHYIKLSLQLPLITTVLASGIQIVIGIYIVFRSPGTKIENFKFLFICFIVMQLFILAEPLRALTVVQRRAYTLFEILCYNDHFSPGDAAGLLQLFEYIFPYVTLYGITVTPAKVAGLILTPLATVAVSVLGPFFQSL